MNKIAAASARLCVETIHFLRSFYRDVAAASARLCVETFMASLITPQFERSRLRAAVC